MKIHYQIFKRGFLGTLFCIFLLACQSNHSTGFSKELQPGDVLVIYYLQGHFSNQDFLSIGNDTYIHVESLEALQESKVPAIPTTEFLFMQSGDKQYVRNTGPSAFVNNAKIAFDQFNQENIEFAASPLSITTGEVQIKIKQRVKLSYSEAYQNCILVKQ